MPMTLATETGSIQPPLIPYCSVVITNGPGTGHNRLEMSLTGNSPIVNADGTLSGGSTPGYPEGPSVVSVDIQYGFDMGTATATVELTANPNMSEWSLVEIFAGSNINSGTYNARRFTGFLMEVNANLWPHTYSLICRGNLYRAEQYRQAQFVGVIAAGGLATGDWSSNLPNGAPLGKPPVLSGVEVVGGRFTGTSYLIGNDFDLMTDQNLVLSILTEVDTPGNPGTWVYGVYPQLALQVSPGNIQGIGDDPNGWTRGFGHTFLAPPMIYQLFWPPLRSAWEMIQPLDEVSLGFRTFEDVGGVIRRRQIIGMPQGDSSYEFDEGYEDVMEGHGTRSVMQLINSTYVEGLQASNSGSTATAAVFAFKQSANPFQSTPIVDQFHSTLIGCSDLTDPAQNSKLLNANRVAEWRLIERNRELVTVQWTTTRDDLIQIGTVAVLRAVHTAVTEPVWVQRVEIRVTASPISFAQTITGLGGGLLQGSPFSPPAPVTPPSDSGDGGGDSAPPPGDSGDSAPPPGDTGDTGDSGGDFGGTVPPPGIGGGIG